MNYILVHAAAINNPPKDYTEIATDFDASLTVSVDTSNESYTILAMTAYSFERLYKIHEFLQFLREQSYLILRD